jgi:hypothetical protein
MEGSMTENRCIRFGESNGVILCLEPRLQCLCFTLHSPSAPNVEYHRQQACEWLSVPKRSSVLAPCNRLSIKRSPPTPTQFLSIFSPFTDRQTLDRKNYHGASKCSTWKLEISQSTQQAWPLTAQPCTSPKYYTQPLGQSLTPP